jgi:hypothetical protein
MSAAVFAILGHSGVHTTFTTRNALSQLHRVAVIQEIAELAPA